MNHFIWLAICFIFIALMLFIAKKFNFSLKFASLIMLGICFLSEITKIMLGMIENVKGGMSLNPLDLPFHLCSLMIFAIIYICFASDNKFRRILINFIAVMGTVGSFCALLIPTNGVSFVELDAYQCFVYHSGLIWFSLYLIIFKHADLGFKSYLTNLVFLASLVILMLYVNSILSVYGTNFFYLVRPPMDDLPILNLNHGWYVYFISLVLLGLVLISLFHLPFIILERLNSKKEEINIE